MNRVKQVVHKDGGIGTSNITVFGSTPAGYVAIADATLPAVFRYTLFDFVGFGWEIGYGSYSGGTFTRGMVVATSDDPHGGGFYNFAAEDLLFSIDTDTSDQAHLTMSLYGDASDGDVTISSGTTTLTRNMYYGTLAITGTGNLRPNGFTIYAHKLDLTAAPANAIEANGNAGSHAASTTGAFGGTVAASTTPIWSNGQAGANGRNGSTGSGSIGFATSAVSATGGRGSSTGAPGGNGTAGAGGAAATPGSFDAVQLGTIAHAWRHGASIYAAASGGVGGSSGAGSGGGTGAGGGGGGASGGTVAIFARLILSGGAPSCISARGGAGGNSTRAAVSGTGGGAGGGGGGGGTVYIVTDAVIGTGVDHVNVGGGAGGNASNGSATSESGEGGRGGDGGVARLFSSVAGASMMVGASGSAGMSKVTNGLNILGGAGGVGLFDLGRVLS